MGIYIYVWKITAAWFFEGIYEAVVGKGVIDVTGRLCKMNGEGELGGGNVETGAALIVFDLWEQICCLLSVGRLSEGKCCWRCCLLGRDNVRLGSIPAFGGGGGQYLADYTASLFRRPLLVGHHREEPHIAQFFSKVVAFARCIVQGRYSIGATSYFTCWHASHIWGRWLHGGGL